MSMMASNMTTDYISVKASFTARGYIRFINIRPESRYGFYVCDEYDCPARRVTGRKFFEHVDNHHAIKPRRG
jgi:Mg/Co/Ni transporter MgtE